MWIVLGTPHPQNRIQMLSTQYYSAFDLVSKSKEQRWPQNAIFLEYSPNCYLKISNEHELAFACELVSRNHVELCQLNSTIITAESPELTLEKARQVIMKTNNPIKPRVLRYTSTTNQQVTPDQSRVTHEQTATKT